MLEIVRYDCQCKHVIFQEVVSRVSGTDRRFHRRVRDECELHYKLEPKARAAVGTSILSCFWSSDHIDLQLSSYRVTFFEALLKDLHT